MIDEDDVLKVQLSSVARGEAIDAAGGLWRSCELGHYRVAKFLLSLGAEVNGAASDGSTPLFMACQNSHLEVTKLLLSVRDLDLNFRRFADGATALYVSSQRGHASIVRLLVSAGAHVNLPRNGGFTPLWTACRCGHKDIVEIFASTVVMKRRSTGNRARGAIVSEVDFGIASTSGVRPADAARRAGHEDLARLVDATLRHQIEAKRLIELRRVKRVGQKEGKPPPKEGGPEMKKGVRWRSESRAAPDAARPTATSMEFEGRANAASGGSQALEQAHTTSLGLPTGDSNNNNELATPSGGDRAPFFANHGSSSNSDAPFSNRDGGGARSLSVWPMTNWSWMGHVREKAHFSHDICACAARTVGVSVGAEKHQSQLQQRQHVCDWWRLRPGSDEEHLHVSKQLMEQVSELHRLAEARSCSQGLHITQIIFTEGRRSSSIINTAASGAKRRAHTLEVRFAHSRDKKQRSDSYATTNDPRLVRTDEVVLFFAIPLRFPREDGHVLVFCLQGRDRFPANVLVAAAKTTAISGGEKTHPYGFPGAPLSLSWITPSVWPSNYTLAAFIEDLIACIETHAKATEEVRIQPAAATAVSRRNSSPRPRQRQEIRGGLQLPRYSLNTFLAGETLAENEAILQGAAQARVARLNAPLTPEEKRAGRFALLGIAAHVLGAFVLLFLKRHGI